MGASHNEPGSPFLNISEGGGEFTNEWFPAGVRSAGQIIDHPWGCGVGGKAQLPFYCHGEGLNTLRLNFSNSTPDKIKAGIKRLAKIF